MDEPVPQMNLSAQYASFRDEALAAITRLCDQQAFILGDAVAGFETALATRFSAPHAVGCASGSDALLLALTAAGLEPGDEVIVPPLTFFATAGAVARAGLKPVFADVDEATLTLDPESARRACTPRTRAIIPVSLYGLRADMDALAALCARRGGLLLEDAAQAFGSAPVYRLDGSDCHMVALSFFPSKNLGAFGDAGALLLGDDEAARRARALRVHGETQRSFHHLLGWNSRLDALQAAVLTVKMARVDGWNLSRREHAREYDRLLDERGLVEILRPPAVRSRTVSGAKCPHVFNQYIVRAPRREELREHLDSMGIATRVYYPVPLHLQPCFDSLGYREGRFPVAEQAARQVLSLPMFPELTTAQQERVADALASFYKE